MSYRKRNSNKKRPKYNTNDMIRKKPLNPKQVNQITNWLSNILNDNTINSDNVFDKIRDGCLLCDAVNKIKPKTCKKYKRSKVAFICRTNIQIFINGCRKLGVPQTDVFETRGILVVCILLYAIYVRIIYIIYF